jgi:hypothetical protein
MAEDRNWAMAAFPSTEYKALISSLLERDYVAVPLSSLVADRRHLFLRHDVDLCPDRALRMARIEQEIGVSATYYFLVSTPHYSIAAAQTRRILRVIHALGHDIGLHFDAAQYADGTDDLDEMAGKECALLELCCEAPVKSISFHRPSPQHLNRHELIAGRRHCYEPAFFSKIGYVSDSNGGWHHGHPLKHQAIQSGSAMQLLTHPIWWCNDTPQTAVQTIEGLFLERSRRVQSDLADTITAYRDALQPGEASSQPIEDRIRA